MRQSKDLAYLRQLCCLGLDKEIVIQEFLNAVRNVLPSDNNIFAITDEQLSPSHFLMEKNAQTTDDAVITTVFNYFSSAHLKSGLFSWLSQYPVFTEPSLLDEKFYRMDMYNMYLL